MRKLALGLSAVLALGLYATLAVAAPPMSKNFNTHLNGAGEVPQRITGAQGQANFQMNKDGTAIGYKVIVANINNVVAAHIHCAPEGSNGGIGVTLFGPAAPAGGRVQGILAQGEFSAPDVGNGCGWLTLADVMNAVQSGITYVNVHTNDGIAPTNTGAGDFPGGEIRGQLKSNGPN